MAALQYVLAHQDDPRWLPELELSRRQLTSAVHFSPLVLERRQDELPAAVAAIAQAVRSCSAQLRALAAADAAERQERQTPPQTRQDAPSAPNGGPRVVAPVPPPTQPPPPALAPTPQPQPIQLQRTPYRPQHHQDVAF
jgi:hypothetical protein